MYLIEKISFRKNKCWYFQVDGVPYYIGFGFLCDTGTRSVSVSNNTNCETVKLLQADVQPYLDAVVQKMCKKSREELVSYLYENYLKYYDNIRWLNNDGVEQPIIPRNGESFAYHNEVAEKISKLSKELMPEEKFSNYKRYIIKKPAE